MLHGEPAQGRGGEEVAGGVVEGLHGKRGRLVGAGPLHSPLRYPAAHLHEAVEPAAGGPGAGEAVGIERYVDEPRTQPPAGVGVEPERIEGAVAVAVDQHIRLPDELTEAGAAGVGARIEAGGALAEGHVGHQRLLLPAGRIDAKHIGSEGGEESRRDGPRDHAREVEHAEAGEGLAGADRPRGAALSAAVDRPVEQGLLRDGDPLRVLRPFLGRAQHGRASAAVDDRLFEFDGGPPRDGAPDREEVPGYAEHAEHGVAVVGRVRVQADPAVPGSVVARDRVPDRGERPADGGDSRSEPGRR